MTQLLASVSNLQEAQIALEAGVDIIDLKNPSQGALGAIALADIRQIVCLIRNSSTPDKIISATIGDLPMQPVLIKAAITAMQDTGVDIIKIGFFADHNHQPCIDSIKTFTQMGQRVVAVLFADQQPTLNDLAKFEAAMFYGVMLDTACKNGKNLLDYLSPGELARFVNLAGQLNLISGLAGSLRPNHIQPLSQLKPDYLGFRGALCDNFERSATISAAKIRQLRDLLHKCNKIHDVTADSFSSCIVDCN